MRHPPPPPPLEIAVGLKWKGKEVASSGPPSLVEKIAIAAYEHIWHLYGEVL